MVWELVELKISNKRKNNGEKGQFEIEDESEMKQSQFGSLEV